MAEPVVGMAELLRKLKNLPMAVIVEAAQALYEEAQIEMKEAKRRTPVDTGALRDSGTVNAPLITSTGISVKLHFGSFDPSSEYAVYVHEDLEANHPNGGQAKFLESTLLESAPYMKRRVAKRINLAKAVK